MRLSCTQRKKHYILFCTVHSNFLLPTATRVTLQHTCMHIVLSQWHSAQGHSFYFIFHLVNKKVWFSLSMTMRGWGLVGPIRDNLELEDTAWDRYSKRLIDAIKPRKFSITGPRGESFEFENYSFRDASSILNNIN